MSILTHFWEIIQPIFLPPIPHPRHFRQTLKSDALKQDIFNGLPREPHIIARRKTTNEISHSVSLTLVSTMLTNTALIQDESWPSAPRTTQEGVHTEVGVSQIAQSIPPRSRMNAAIGGSLGAQCPRAARFLAM